MHRDQEAAGRSSASDVSASYPIGLNGTAPIASEYTKMFILCGLVFVEKVRFGPTPPSKSVPPPAAESATRFQLAPFWSTNLRFGMQAKVLASWQAHLRYCVPSD